MISNFSFDSAKAELEGDVGYAFDLESPFDQAKAIGGLASSAHAFMNSAIKCYLVGLVTEGNQLARKSAEWLEAAIEFDERPTRYFANGTEAARLYDLALCRWLLDAVYDEKSLVASVNYRERYLAGPAARDRVEVAFVLPEYLDAGKSELVRGHVDRLWKSRNRPIEVQLAYCPAQDHEGLPDSCGSQVDSLLQKHVSDWLNRGNFCLLATWLKVTMWNIDRQRAPSNVLLESLKYV